MNGLPEKERPTRKLPRRLLVWSAVVLGLLAALLVLITLLAPKIINTNAVRAAIERTVSEELGGTVTVDRLNLVLFPRPEIDIRNLTIEVPGTVSASVAAVGVSAQFLPLLQGRFAVSSVTLDRPVLGVILPGTAAKSRKRPSQKTKPAVRSVGEVLTVASRAVPDLSLKVSAGRLSLIRDDRTILSVEDLDAGFAFVPVDRETASPAAGPPREQYHVAGSAKAVLSGTMALPGPLRLSLDRFDVDPRRFVVKKSRARLLDMDAALGGAIEGYLSAAPKADITASGSIGPDAAVWIRGLAGIPGDVMVHTPLTVTTVRLRSSGTGSVFSRELTGSITLRESATASFAMHMKPGVLTVERLEVKDGDSDAILRLTSGPRDLDVAFTGTLTGETVNRMVDRKQPLFRRIAGDIRVHLPRGQWQDVSAEGNLEGEGVVIPSLLTGLTGTVVLDRLSAHARGRTADIRPVVLSLGKNSAAAEGTASLTGSGVALDLDVSADRINAADLQEMLKARKAGGEQKAAPPADRRQSFEADLRIRAAMVTFSTFTAESVAVNLSLANGRTTADLKQATVCGIGVVGSLQAADHDVEVRIEPRVLGGALYESIQCIRSNTAQTTGTYDLTGRLTGSGPWDALLSSLRGDIALTAKQGRIQNDRIVRGIIVYLNSTSLLKESHSSLLKEGVPYETISLRGSVKDGVIRLQQGLIKSKDINITAEGDIDLRKETLDLTVLAAPFTSMDRLLGSIPIVKQIAGKALIVVPVKVEGPLRELKVRPLAASGVSMNITNLMKNIVQAPVKIVEPVLPGERGKDTVQEQP